jgi:N-hydroxyarylamine O-acetyltransferase
MDVVGYLRRLGVTHPGPPSVDRLFALHRAHVSVVPYETLEIQLDRPTTIDPIASAERIIAGRGGYCFHLNGAFAMLLEELGYDVSRHIGGVYSSARPSQGANGNHVALTVGVEGSRWFVDAGLGDALYEPMPLVAGAVAQGPYVYRLEHSPVAPGGWRFVHDEKAGSFGGMDFAPEPVRIDAFAGRHAELSTSPESPFVAIPQVGRRTADGVDFIRGCTLFETGRERRVLTSADEWFGVVADVFGMPLADVGSDERAALFARFWTAHERYLATRT